MAKPKRRSPSKGPTRAQGADRHELYEKAVQAPEVDIEFFDETYRELRGRRPQSMREDFCGTANLSSEWCRSDPGRRAIGIDLDDEVLAWGKEHHLDPFPGLAERVTLVHGNVLEPVGGEVDLVCAMNFSYCVFKTRSELRRYFESAHRGLAVDGLFVCELYGGTEAVVEIEDVEDKEGFVYHWDQARYDPLTHETLCHIHFSFADGSKLEKAFTYDWRLWTIPEIRELLLEAGFSRVRVYWEEMEEDEDEDEDEMVGTGEFVEVEEAENQEAWLCYIVGEP